MLIWFILLHVHILLNIGFCEIEENIIDINNTDRYIISCRSTDFECFKRQHRALRDHVLVGNQELGIPYYEHYLLKYDNETCIKLSGWEESELVMIGFNGLTKTFNMAFELPLRLQQVKSANKTCHNPEKEFGGVKQQKVPGPLMRYTGNATVQVAYPYTLHRKKDQIYMALGEEDVEVELEIPDLTHFDIKSIVEEKLLQWSEWAYEVVQHFDAAEHFAVPYTGQLRILMHHLPLSRLLLLYPDETYGTLRFSYSQVFNDY